MTVDQQSIEYIKERIKGIATHGIRQTLLDVQDELNLLSHLLGAGTEASVAEIHAACNNLDVLVSDPSGDEARARKIRNEHLGEQLSSLLATVGVVICAIASVRGNAEVWNDIFQSCDQLDIEEALIDALVRHPECLDDEVAEEVMRQEDNLATATLRRQLNNLLKVEEHVNG